MTSHNLYLTTIVIACYCNRVVYPSLSYQHVDLSNDTAHWRGEIGTFFTEQDWSDWFQSYTVYLNHIATLAQEESVNLFIVGTELSVTQPQVWMMSVGLMLVAWQLPLKESSWRDVISSVRGIYTGTRELDFDDDEMTYQCVRFWQIGPLVYGANWDTTNLTWWDAVDYIGVDAYFPLTQESAPSVDVLVQGWQPYLTSLSQLSQGIDYILSIFLSQRLPDSLLLSDRQSETDHIHWDWLSKPLWRGNHPMASLWLSRPASTLTKLIVLHHLNQ